MEKQENKGLDRYLSPADTWAMAFGCMVGWGAFVMPGTTFLPLAGPLGTVIAMIISVAIMLVIGNNFAYLMNRNPMTGGVYSYTKEAFGRDHAFLSSWFLCLSYLSIVFLNATAVYLVIRTAFNGALQGGYAYEIAGNTIYLGELVTSVLILVFIGFLFIIAKPILQKLHTVLALILLAGVIATSVVCLPHVSREALLSFGTAELNPAYAIFSIVILAPWAFVGFEVISFDTAHFRFDIRKSRSIIIVSILAGGLAYMTMAVINAAAMPDGFSSWVEYINALGSLSGIASVPTFYVAREIMGTGGLVVITITAMAAIITGIIGGYRAAIRVLSTMAEDRILSERFSRTTYSILFVMVLSIALSLLGRNTLNWFVDVTSFGAIVGFGYTSAAAYKIGKTEGNRKILISALAGAVISVLFVLVQLIPRLTAMEAMGAEAFLLLSLWCLLGFVFYWRTIKRSTLTEYSGMSTSGIALFALLLYTVFMWLAKRIDAQESLEAVHKNIIAGGVILMIIVFIGLTVMLYVQNLVRQQHEMSERDKIRAVEGNLAKSQFLFNMSHDIRTPMNAIIGYTNLALDEENSPKVEEYLNKINNSSKHLLSLINDILEMSRIESGKLELEYVPADIISVFDGMRDLFHEQMKQKDMDFNVYTSQISDRYVWCDKKNLNRILLNLLSNAYKFTPEGGSISLSLYEMGGNEDGYGSYEIRVKDSGIGMSREFVEKMFNAFEREHTSTVSGIEGTGLGLAITKSLADLMGGTIEVLTSPGSGSEFILRFKFRLAAESDMPKEEKKKNGAAGTDFTGRKLLLVEDNLINMEIAKAILGQLGFAIDTAENGQIAVDKVKASKPGDYDLILMDVQMPVMDGYTATKAIRNLEDKDLSEIPVIAMTANAFKEDELASADAGMQGHIAKPIDVNVMMETIAEVLNKQEN
ncbi:MAG: amino acid permease [Erysipelotrichaceae bacterium]|nr:amino acid permease [Erysipelotrichaceae bacterium]